MRSCKIFNFPFSRQLVMKVGQYQVLITETKFGTLHQHFNLFIIITSVSAALVAACSRSAFAAAASNLRVAPSDANF